MTERISIRKFGPIQEADIEVRDLTIFVGPQATGKSMAAQLLYFMRGIAEFLPLGTDAGRKSPSGDYDPQFDTFATQQVIYALQWWLGNSSGVYAQPGTKLSWCPSIAQETITYDIDWDQEKIRLNYFLETMLGEQAIPKVEKKATHQTYIPAGRALYSYLSLALAFPLLTRNNNRPEWPGYIFRFYQTLESTIKSLWEYQERPTTSFWEGELSPFLQTRMEKVLKGKVRYGPNAILLKTGGQTLRPDTIAAGQMEAWPFFAILEDAIHKGETEKLRIYFDEPEAHLHPGAQRVMMEIIAALVRDGAQIVMTTHSPYILYALNNSLAAGEVLSKGRPLPPELPAEIALFPQQVAAYCFPYKKSLEEIDEESLRDMDERLLSDIDGGSVRDIMDREVGLIDSAELNRVAEELGSDFTAMQELLLDGEAEQDA